MEHIIKFERYMKISKNHLEHSTFKNFTALNSMKEFLF